MLIGIAGKSASGKDTIADYLIDKLGGGHWNKFALAYNVKKIFRNTFGVDRDFIEKWKRNPEPPPGFLKNVRQGLQFIGNGFRSIDNNIWIKLLFKEINHNKNYFISDVRYENECIAIKKNSGLNILVWRPGESNDTNQSEIDLDHITNYYLRENVEFDAIKYSIISNFDCFIKNDSTIEHLYNKLDHVIKMLNLESF